MRSPRSPLLASALVRNAIGGVVFLLSCAAAWWLKDRGYLLIGIVVLLAAFVGWRWLAKKLAVLDSPPSEPPMVSLVLLLKQPRYLEAKVLAEILRTAWGMTFSAAEPDNDTSDTGAPQPWIAGESPVFMVNTGAAIFIVHNHEKLYFEEVDDVAARVPELRQRTIILEHRAWLSVDAMRVEGEAETAIAYAKIARALAELADDSVLGLFQPASNRLTAWEPALETRLRKGENLAELFAVNQVPVEEIPDNDPRMKAAVAEARLRFPEFRAAFQARKPGGHYAVKAPITRDDNTEYIWMEVIGLEPEYIHGTLANDPVKLGGLKIGDRVEVPIAELNNWMCLDADNEEPRGMFTVKIVTSAFQQQLGEAPATDS